MKNPQGDGFRGPLRQNDETLEKAGEVIEEQAAIDWIGPRLDGGEFEEGVGRTGTRGGMPRGRSLVLGEI